jgi:hypothetical protein
MFMEYSEREYTDAGIYISIIFARNANRVPAWRFVIDNVEDELYSSRLFSDRDDCEREAELKAREYLPVNKGLAAWAKRVYKKYASK